jgi:GMP synthase PP-ATPase subunit
LREDFKGEVVEIAVRMSLDTNTTYHLPLGGAGLVLQEEVVLE